MPDGGAGVWSSEPVEKLRPGEAGLALAAAVAPVVLIAGLEADVTTHQVADRPLDAASPARPRCAARRSTATIREKPSRSPRTATDHRGVSATRVSIELPSARRALGRVAVLEGHVPAARHHLAAHHDVAEGVFGVQAERLLAMRLRARRLGQAADVAVVGLAAGVGDELAARAPRRRD